MAHFHLRSISVCTTIKAAALDVEEYPETFNWVLEIRYLVVNFIKFKGFIHERFLQLVKGLVTVFEEIQPLLSVGSYDIQTTFVNFILHPDRQDLSQIVVGGNQLVLEYWQVGNLFL